MFGVADQDWFIANLCLFEASLIVVVMIHEAGHALVGRWVGLHVQEIYPEDLDGHFLVLGWNSQA